MGLESRGNRAGGISGPAQFCDSLDGGFAEPARGTVPCNRRGVERTLHRFEDPLEPGRNGMEYLGPCLGSHTPLDLVVLMLGTNDLKSRFGLPPGDIADGVFQLVRLIQRSESGPDRAAPRVLVLAPPPVGDLRGMPELSEKFLFASEKSRRLPELMEQVALGTGEHFLDIQGLVEPSPVDGLHLSGVEHGKLGRAVAAAVLGIFPFGQDGLDS